MEKVCLCLCHTGIPKYRNSYNYCVVQSYHTTPGLMIIHHSCIKTYVFDLLIVSNVHSFSKYYNLIYFMAINQPTTSGFKTRRGGLPYSLSALVYFVQKIRKTTIGHQSTRHVFSLCQFWYLYMLLYSVLFQVESIYLLLASSKREEVLFLVMHCQLLYILYTLS